MIFFFYYFEVVSIPSSSLMVSEEKHLLVLSHFHFYFVKKNHLVQTSLKTFRLIRMKKGDGGVLLYPSSPGHGIPPSTPPYPTPNLPAPPDLLFLDNASYSVCTCMKILKRQNGIDIINMIAI